MEELRINPSSLPIIYRKLCRFTKVENGCDAFAQLKAVGGQTQCGKFFLGNDKYSTVKGRGLISYVEKQLAVSNLAVLTKNEKYAVKLKYQKTCTIMHM
jgi:hypothetical protein